MLNRRVDLRFPIEIPGSTITFVTARPLTQAEFDHSFTGPDGPLEAFASCVGLPVGVAAEMSAVDYDRVTTAIAELNGRAAEDALAARRGAFTVIAGGKQ